MSSSNANISIKSSKVNINSSNTTINTCSKVNITIIVQYEYL